MSVHPAIGTSAPSSCEHASARRRSVRGSTSPSDQAGVRMTGTGLACTLDDGARPGAPRPRRRSTNSPCSGTGCRRAPTRMSSVPMRGGIAHAAIDHPRRADPALRPALARRTRAAHGSSARAPRWSVDPRALDLRGRDEARHSPAPVDQHGAGAALALAAALLGAGQAAGLAQHVEQACQRVACTVRCSPLTERVIVSSAARHCEPWPAMMRSGVAGTSRAS